MQERPNFLLLMTDQQRADNYGFAGHAVVRTPNLDELARAGSWWSQCYTASPSCMANRASLMTGRMPSNHGVRFNGIPLDRDAVTFVDLLRADGYRTALVGKSHLQCLSSDRSHAPPPRQFTGRRRIEDLPEARRSRFTVEDYRAESVKAWRENPDEARKTPLPFYGFEEVAFCLGHGDVVTGHYEDWLRAKGHPLRAGPEFAEQASDSGAPQLYKPATPEELYPTSYVAEHTNKLLAELAQSSQPFFLQCSFPDPHHPFTPPGKYYDMFEPAEVSLPASFAPPDDRSVPPLRHLWAAFEAGDTPARFSHPFVTGEDQARDIIAKNYGQIAMIDDAIGAVLAQLQSLGLDKNTVVCFVADHGEYLGDHGLFLKGPFHYQSLIRTPFVWKDPDPSQNVGQRDVLASSLDLATTVLSRAGIQPFNGIQGVDLLSDDARDRRSYVLVEHTNQFVYMGFEDLVAVHSYVDTQWRLSVWQGCDWGELYDLSADPDELKNLWSSPALAEVKAELLLRLIHGVQDHAETSPFPMAVS
ncbi:MAG: sulfatase-like hydrolase/transferase [Pseudomonadota bacterium]